MRTSGSSEAFTARNVRYEAGNAVAYGMEWNAALRAITLTPAETFGVADRVGSLSVGKIADVVVWSGDPFEFATQAEHVFVNGVRSSAPSRRGPARSALQDAAAGVPASLSYSAAAASVSSSSHRATSASISADSRSRRSRASSTALPSRSTAGSDSEAYAASRSRSFASIESGSDVELGSLLEREPSLLRLARRLRRRRRALRRRRGGDFRRPLPHPVGVAADVLADPAASLEHERARHRVVEERAVVAHEQQRPRELDEQLPRAGRASRGRGRSSARRSRAG